MPRHAEVTLDVHDWTPEEIYSYRTQTRHDLHVTPVSTNSQPSETSIPLQQQARLDSEALLNTLESLSPIPPHTDPVLNDYYQWLVEDSRGLLSDHLDTREDSVIASPKTQPTSKKGRSTFKEFIQRIESIE